jgi:hypothetical protein
MKKNMGTIDIAARLLVAALLIVLYFMQVVTGTAGILLLVIAGVFVLTGIVRFCPLYLPFGINTQGKK